MANLFTKPEYKAAMAIDSTTQDVEIDFFIPIVSSQVENYCERKFLDYYDSPGVTEWFDGKVELITLNHFPLIIVNDVSVSADGGVTQVSLVENATTKDGYFVDLNEGQIRVQVATRHFIDTYDTPYRSIEINYNAGYSDIPDDLKGACILLLEFYLKQDYRPSKSLSGASVENTFPTNSFPPHIRRVFDLYRMSA